MTGSLSLGGASVYSSASTQPSDDTKQPMTSSSKHPDRDDRPNKPIEKSSSLFTMPSRKEGRKSSAEGANMPMLMSLTSPHTHHNEPQLTPSISNIGGAVLRSKTADFERLLLQNKRSGGNLSTSESNALVQTTDTTTDTTAASQTKKQPIYKRRELISSVQSSKK